MDYCTGRPFVLLFLLFLPSRCRLYKNTAFYNRSFCRCDKSYDVIYTATEIHGSLAAKDSSCKGGPTLSYFIGHKTPVHLWVDLFVRSPHRSSKTRETPKQPKQTNKRAHLSFCLCSLRKDERLPRSGHVVFFANIVFKSIVGVGVASAVCCWVYSNANDGEKRILDCHSIIIAMVCDFFFCYFDTKFLGLLFQIVCIRSTAIGRILTIERVDCRRIDSKVLSRHGKGQSGIR